MKFIENLKQAFFAFGSNKLRSFLTTLGIIMGVFSIIAIMAIGNAAQTFMASEFERMGSNTIMIQYSGSNITQDDWLYYEDLEMLVDQIPQIRNISAYGWSGGTINFEDDTRRVTVQGITSQYSSFQTIDIAAGRFINEIDFSEVRNVAFVDDNFARRHFNRVDIVGEEIALESHSGNVIRLMIIGVQSTEGDLFASMMSDDAFPANVYIPLSTYQHFYNQQALEGIDMSVEDGSDLQSVGERAIRLLEFRKDNENKYQATSVQEIQEGVGEILNVISLVLLAIAAITLVVGGIGIVNILLVSVTERIREIGIRKALGAQKRDIVFQFLMESIIITGFGGVIGILIGIIVGNVLSKLINIPPVVDLKLIIGAFLISVILGIIFGVYPAKKAADLDPIEAIRHE
ncbi:ABC transporter permease [Herbivorax sp. ANBcel31]|uniref:ABC transporter permease n=1 Tax=Herbivorax sp. ANBcel31 TaxID=3069754 RepID=UPI0027B7D5EF|nr:ABC transporter permease [Herbivorax sp. ANBcel31]MDQ2087565.1 ABC transporter permease [Herbivorax sp. ANBcel31]